MRQPNHQQLLSPGTRLNEWVVGAPLAAGPFAVLYEGQGTHVAEPVVIKEYFPAAVAQRLDGKLAVLDAPGAAERYAAALERFIVQARLLRGVTEHKAPPHLAAVRSVIKANNTAYLVMARAAGTPMRDTARLDGAAAEALIRRLGRARTGARGRRRPRPYRARQHPRRRGRRADADRLRLGALRQRRRG
jgi:hypothetical protein